MVRCAFASLCVAVTPAHSANAGAAGIGVRLRLRGFWGAVLAILAGHVDRNPRAAGGLGCLLAIGTGGALCWVPYLQSVSWRSSKQRCLC